MQNSVDTLYDNLAFTHKVHEKQCEVLSFASALMKIVSIINVVVVLLLQFWQILSPVGGKNLVLWSIYLTVGEVGLVAFQLNFNYEKLYEQHRSAAKQALALKNRFLVFKNNLPIDANKLTKYVDEINDLYMAAPQTSRFAKFLANRS